MRTPAHHAALEQVVLTAFSADPPCQRKGNHPPGTAARAEAGKLLAGLGPDVTVDLADWAELAEVAQ
ncbi:MAG: hypothetical protein ACRDRJ_33455 [Streptosporangiaceae bacterium]